MEDSVLVKLDQFFSQFHLLHYKKRETILRAEDNPAGVFYLKRGYVRLYSISEEGRELTLNIFKPGSYFSLMWAIGDSPNVYFFEAMTAVDVWRAPKEKVLDFLKKEPAVLFKLTRRILVGLSGLLATICHLLSGNAYAKVAFVLLTAAKRFGEKKGNGQTVIQLALTHQDIANLAGLTRETTSLEMKKLEDRGVITRQNRLWVIKNIENLEEESLIFQEEKSSPHAF